MTSYLGAPNWRPAKLRDLVFLQRGFDITKAQQQEGPYPVISSSGPNSTHSEFMAHGPGVVIGRKGSLGTVFFSEGDYWPHDTTLWSKSFGGNEPQFVYYALRSLPLDRFNVGGANPTLNRNHIHDLPIRLPDKPTQQRVADLLGSYDDLIENNRRRIQLLEESARLLYREWFVHLRFPGHEHVKVVDGVPEGWERAKLGSALILQRGFDLPVNSRKPGDIPVYASTGIVGYHYTAKVQGPGVVTGRSGSLGNVAYVHSDHWPLNTTLWVKEFLKVSPVFAYYLLSGLDLERYNGGAAVPTLNRNDVHRIEVALPPERLIRDFSEYAVVTFNHIQTLKRYSAKLEEARDLLLPRLMNGDLAV